jgi:NADH:ubiquinone oxidoreductase subunit 5 (subunit L)/multisubunit Na+/H+ antiporter MnhA subunit
VDLFEFTPGSPMSVALMAVGAVTILCAVMMALIQKDFKRLLSYHAISQVGYMILGIGTALPVGIVGGLFHMFNNAVYKSCLFYTAGSVERQAGTTDLKSLSGLGRRMPVTMITFLVAAVSIAGVPLTNGFFSKEMIFDGALESGLVFYLAALLGAFFTALSFLKLGHVAFFGKPGKALSKIKEAPIAMLLPTLILAVACLAMAALQGTIVAGLKEAVYTAHVVAQTAGSGTNWLLAGVSAAVLLLAAFVHIAEYRKKGNGFAAADLFHHAPVLGGIYTLAERGAFDPYRIGDAFTRGFSAAALAVNDAINWFYDVAVVRATDFLSGLIRAAHNGSKTLYLGWTLAGVLLVAAIVAASL